MFFNICKFKNVFITETTIIKNTIKIYLISKRISNCIQKVKYKKIIIKNQTINAKYLNIVFDKIHASKDFFRNDIETESNQAEIIHNKTQNIVI